MSDFKNKETLIAEIQKLKENLECHQQLLHVTTTSLKTAKQMENDYLEEINCIKASTEKHRALQAENEELGKMISVMKNEFAREINELELRLEEKEEATQYSVLESSIISTNSIIEEVEFLYQTERDLKAQVEQLQETIEATKKHNEEELEEISKQYSNIESSLRQEISEIKTHNENLEEELVVLKSELDNFSGDTKKANSIFSELNDKRLEVQNEMKKIKAEYLDVQRRNSQLSKTAKNLEMSVYKMQREAERIVTTRNLNFEGFQITYRDEIKTLKELIELTKSHIEEVAHRLEGAETTPLELKVYDDKLQKKTEEIDRLKDRYVKGRSINNVILQMKVDDARKELKKAEAECFYLKKDLEKLQTEAENLKKPPVLPTNQSELPQQPKPILKNVEGIQKEPEKNENNTRGVRFGNGTESEKESQPRARYGGKLYVFSDRKKKS